MNIAACTAAACPITRLEEKNVCQPYDALDCFFEDFTLAESKKLLWELYQGWVTGEMGEYSNPKMPATILFFYTHVEMLVEAAWMLNKKQKAKKTTR